jgi:ubiquinone/menaquinone biosynthesis C-methylase UbiE
VVTLINPATGLELSEEGDALTDAAGTRFPIIAGVPRICAADNYTDNFGLQWNTFASTQIDRSNEGIDLSSRRFFAETGWPRGGLEGEHVLEVGSGAGRFTRVVLEETKARLWSVDYSSAVEANLRNNADVAGGRLRLFQASIYELPFPDSSFDKVFCLGVLQHTPDFEASVRALVAKAKPGGEIVVDFYPIRGWWTKLNAKYLLRPLTKRMAHDRLLKLIDRNIDWLMAAHRGLTRVGLGGLTRFLPIADLRHILPKQLTPAQAREWAVLDTFDMYSPAYDNPQRIARVADMFRRSGATVTFADYVDLGEAQAAVVRATKNPAA